MLKLEMVIFAQQFWCVEKEILTVSEYERGVPFKNRLYNHFNKNYMKN